MGTEHTFSGFDNIGDSSPEEIIKTNLVNFLDWGFLDKGAYFNVNLQQSGVYGGNQSQLRPVSDPRYNDGQIWEGFRGNWCWESGTAQPIQPIQISGVYVNGTFNPLSGLNYYIDYPNGRFVFNSGINTNSTVTCEYSYKYIGVYDANNIPWFREIQYRSFRLDDSSFLQDGSGNWDTIDDIRLQLPAILIEMGTTTYKPYQIGFGAYMYNDVICHVITEDSNTAIKIADYLGIQKEKTIFIFDTNLLAQSGIFPLDQRGMVNSGAMTFPQLVQDFPAGFKWRKLRFSDVAVQPLNTINRGLFIKPVRYQTEVVITSI